MDVEEEPNSPKLGGHSHMEQGIPDQGVRKWFAKHTVKKYDSRILSKFVPKLVPIHGTVNRIQSLGP